MVKKEPILRSMATAPSLPLENILGTLPRPIREAIAVLRSENEKAVMATAGVAALSGALPNVRGGYETQTFGPALIALVVAPPGSGKRAVGLARRLIQPTDTLLEEEYEVELREWQQRSSARKGPAEH